MICKKDPYLTILSYRPAFPKIAKKTFCFAYLLKCHLYRYIDLDGIRVPITHIAKNPDPVFYIEMNKILAFLLPDDSLRAFFQIAIALFNSVFTSSEADSEDIISKAFSIY